MTLLGTWFSNARGRFAYEVAPRDLALGEIITAFHGTRLTAIAMATVKMGEPVWFQLVAIS